MSYSIELAWGRFSISHNCDEESSDAIENGSYKKITNLLSGQMATFLEAGLLRDDDEPPKEIFISEISSDPEENEDEAENQDQG